MYMISSKHKTYLDIPPPVTCPGLSIEALVVDTIMFEEALCVPDEVWGEERVCK
jgi:hypothetical protein